MEKGIKTRARQTTATIVRWSRGLSPGHLQWGTKLLRQLTRYELIYPPFPLAPNNVVVCAGLYTQACPESFSSSQHCLQGSGRAILGIPVVREGLITLYLIIC